MGIYSPTPHVTYGPIIVIMAFWGILHDLPVRSFLNSPKDYTAINDVDRHVLEPSDDPILIFLIAVFDEDIAYCRSVARVEQ
jgi:hypothetical protein